MESNQHHLSNLPGFPGLKKSKIKHIDACMLDESQYRKSTGLEAVNLPHEALASINFCDVSTKTKFLGKVLGAPFLIAPMTGGSELGKLLNQRWARAAEHFNIAMGVGSQRLALMNHRVADSFSVRKWAKSAFIFANLGVAQVIEENGTDALIRAVDMIEANAVFIHINPMQEIIQSHGDRDFSKALLGIENSSKQLKKLGIPLFVREVGFGFSEEAAKKLIETGISGIDCAGAGGTSWAKVEGICSTDKRGQGLGSCFGEWGIKTADSIRNCRKASKDIPLIATGGIRSGLDIAKAIYLGADLGSMARPFLLAAKHSEEELFCFIESLIEELKVAMFGSGVLSVKELHDLGDKN